MLVRRERPADVAAVRVVVEAAFTSEDTAGVTPLEVRLVDELRADGGWLPALSLVAVAPSADAVIGHVVCTRATVDGSPVLGLGPLAVHPDWQRRGAGTALMHAVLGAAEALDEPLVGLLGDPGYYGRFGFHASSEYGIRAPDPAWGVHFQVRVLSAYRGARGVFGYAEPFTRL